MPRAGGLGSTRSAASRGRSFGSARGCAPSATSCRWWRSGSTGACFLGDDRGAPRPDHARLARIRDRYGLEIVRRCFEMIVAHCLAAGLVWEGDRSFAATQGAANASQRRPRFRGPPLRRRGARGGARHCGGCPQDIAEGGERNDLPRLPVALTADAPAALAEAAARRHDGIGHAGRPARTLIGGNSRRVADVRACVTDSDAALTRERGGGRDLGDHDHDGVDGGKARIILAPW